jgi:hypothetical protein
MADITYCINAQCPFKDCDRHLSRLELSKEKFVDLANFDSICERYLTYLLEVVENG